MEFSDLRNGQKFIDAMEIRHAGTRGLFIKVDFIKIDSKDFSMQTQKDNTGFSIDLTTGKPMLFSLDHPVVEVKL